MRQRTSAVVRLSHASISDWPHTNCALILAEVSMQSAKSASRSVIALSGNVTRRQNRKYSRPSRPRSAAFASGSHSRERALGFDIREPVARRRAHRVTAPDASHATRCRIRRPPRCRPPTSPRSR